MNDSRDRRRRPDRGFARRGSSANTTIGARGIAGVAFGTRERRRLPRPADGARQRQHGRLRAAASRCGTSTRSGLADLTAESAQGRATCALRTSTATASTKSSATSRRRRPTPGRSRCCTSTRATANYADFGRRLGARRSAASAARCSRPTSTTTATSTCSRRTTRPGATAPATGCSSMTARAHSRTPPPPRASTPIRPGDAYVPRGGQAVDFDEDGFVDLLFGSRLLLNNGDGTFQRRQRGRQLPGPRGRRASS